MFIIIVLLCFGYTLCKDLAACDSQIYCDGPLLHAIQMAKIFPDGKTFVDMSMKENPDVIISAFNNLTNQSRTTLKNFVSQYFTGPGEELETWAPTDYVKLPLFLNDINDPQLKDFGWDLCRIWKDLGRKVKDDVKLNPDRYSMIYLPKPFIVPGGRFRETFYWDSYWVIKGLLVCEMNTTVKGMMENFVHYVKTFGFIPNGGRTYFSRRSQPPFFIPMMYEYFKATGDREFIRRNLHTLEAEYQFWMKHRTVSVERGGKMHLLNQYQSDVSKPRPESYFEDVKTAEQINIADRPKLYSNLVSACESGWDFSSRWFSRDKRENLTLNTIATMDIIPVDLNSILCLNEMILMKFARIIELEKNLISYENVEHAKQLYSKLCERFEQFKLAHLQCLDLCTQSEVIENLEVNYERCHENFVEFRDRFSQYIASEKSHEEEIPEESDTVSIDSSLSSRSSVSSQSRFRSAKAERLIAELKLRKLSEQHELERAQIEIKFRQQVFNQLSEMEEANIEESVWQEAVEEDTDNTSGIVNIRNISQTVSQTLQSSVPASEKCINMNSLSGQTAATDKPKMNINNSTQGISAQSGFSDVSVSSIDSAFQRLASTLHEGFNLPKPELLTFNGTPLDYSKFIRNFETNIEGRISDNSLRLSYLIQYCRGEAKCCIEDCVLLDSDEGYKRARAILYSRYGRPHVIARSFIEKLVYGAQIKASDIEGLSKLALEMQKCEITLSQLGFNSDIDNSENLRCIVKRFPMHMRTRWVDIAHSISESGREPRFSDLAKFVDEKSRIASSMYGYDLCRENNQNKTDKRVFTSNHHNNDTVNSKVTTLSTQSLNNTAKYEHKCKCCTGTCVDLTACSKFKSMSLDDRKSKACTVSDCNVKHNILLHSWSKPGFDHAATQPSVNCAATKGSMIKNCLGIIPVLVKGRNGNSCKTFALLDDGADKTLCDERLLQKLNIVSKPVTFEMSTVNSSGCTIHGQEVDLQVKAIDGNDKVSLKKVWSVKKLPISARSAAENVDIRKLPYLADIQIPLY
ncbi:TREH [Mytilus edulis]|uniref:Trehalase n=1 Tax=Mytilus edulis TaxID=6550 RepID=A0A8S3QSP5_MYTED|nr:TREH [Mytilus edulis]